MFEDLNWKYAARRAAIVIAIYLGLLYVLSIAFPETNFRLDTREQILSLLINAVFFFVIFTLVYAFIDRSRRRRLGEMSQSRRQSKPSANGEGGPLKGRPNPNTSRKKARRKR